MGTRVCPCRHSVFLHYCCFLYTLADTALFASTMASTVLVLCVVLSVLAVSQAFVASNPLMMMYMMQEMGIGGGEMQQMLPLMMMSSMMPSMMNPAAGQSGATY